MQLPAAGLGVPALSTAHDAGRKLVVALAAMGGGPRHKTLHLMRHGTTEMNVYLREVSAYGSPGFQDPLFYDTRLTEKGRTQAAGSGKLVQKFASDTELLVVSPLARALQTAQLAWLPHYSGPVTVEALARERVWLSSDVGSHPDSLHQEFGQDGRFSFDHLPDLWWYHAETYDPKHVSLEPESVFSERVQEFKRWLLARPERVIGVVAHWGLLSELTAGADFANCEIQTYMLEESGRLKQRGPLALPKFW